MKISSISDSDSKKNLFLQYENQLMSFKADSDEKTENVSKSEINPIKKANKSMGIETLTIFPKQVIDGKTTIIA